MSAYTVKPIDTYRQWSANAAPLTREAYDALAHPHRSLPATLNDSVDLSKSSLSSYVNSLQTGGRNGSSSFSAMVGTLMPSASSGFSSGLYAGVGQLSSSQMESLINGYV